MLFFLTIFILLSAAAVIVTVSVFLRRQKSLPPPEIPLQFQPPIQYQSIFAPSEAEIRAFEAEEKARQGETLRQKILAKAETLDFNALIEAKDFEAEFYDRVLKELIFRCDAERFASLSSFIGENKLRTNAEFIKRFQHARENSLSRKDLIQFLHFAALSQSAQIFSDSIENVTEISPSVKDFTQSDLIQLAESEFWLLPQAEKTSGAGFLLKQKLAKLRSEVQEKRF